MVSASRFHASRFCNTALSPSDTTDVLSSIIDNTRPTNKETLCKALDFGCSTADNGNAISALNSAGVATPETVCNALDNSNVANKDDLCNGPDCSQPTQKTKGI